MNLLFARIPVMCMDEHAWLPDSAGGGTRLGWDPGVRPTPNFCVSGLWSNS
jgi:hypothetical protein